MERMKGLVDAKRLKDILLIKSDFSAWVKRNITNNELVENKDFFIKKEKVRTLNSKVVKLNYVFTLNATQRIISAYPKNKIAAEIREKVEKGEKLEEILKQIEIKKEAEMKIIKINDNEYPENLKKIKNPPKQLYVKGNLGNLKEIGIAVIGKRKCSMYGRKVCKIFTNNLVGYNLNIISGLATGIDACAHRSCIEVKRKDSSCITIRI